MTNKYRYFIANWKMFGQLSSIKILKRVNSYLNKVKNNNSKVIFCPPYTLLNSFAKQLNKSLKMLHNPFNILKNDSKVLESF